MNPPGSLSAPARADPRKLWARLAIFALLLGAAIVIGRAVRAYTGPASSLGSLLGAGVAVVAVLFLSKAITPGQWNDAAP